MGFIVYSFFKRGLGAPNIYLQEMIDLTDLRQQVLLEHLFNIHSQLQEDFLASMR